MEYINLINLIKDYYRDLFIDINNAVYPEEIEIPHVGKCKVYVFDDITNVPLEFCEKNTKWFQENFEFSEEEDKVSLKKGIIIVPPDGVELVITFMNDYIWLEEEIISIPFTDEIITKYPSKTDIDISRFIDALPL